MNSMLLTDFYKPHHQDQYPPGMTKLYSNGTCRKSRFPFIKEVVVWGLQHFVKEYLIKDFNENFFKTNLRGLKTYSSAGALKLLRDEVIEEYQRHVPIDTKRIEALWNLGYLPIEMKSLDEGTLCPIGVPMFTITNTHPDFAWLVNYLETLISCSIWQSFTSATLALQFKKLLTEYAIVTTGNADGVQWQAHDFSMRGMSSLESAVLSGMAHLTSFTGTDVVPAIYQLEKSYDATGLIGASVPATEHSVMCMGTKEAEIDTFRRLLETYPKDYLSVVSDTWNLWEIVKKGGLCDQLKDEIMARDGKLVIRPDSGNPVDILCGYPKGSYHTTETKGEYYIPTQSAGTDKIVSEHEIKGLVELLWDRFGGTEVEGADGKMYKVLDSHIGAIYGDAINLERAQQICERLKEKGFASTNVVLGVGSFTYQHNTRDTFGFAIKATYGEITHPVDEEDEQAYVEAREIFKDPITDSGTKKSKKGLLLVGYEADGSMGVRDQQTWEQEKKGYLTTLFKDGKLIKTVTLEEVRERINSKI